MKFNENKILIPNNALSIIVLFLFIHWNIRLIGHKRAGIIKRQDKIKKIINSLSDKKVSSLEKIIKISSIIKLFW